MSDILCFDIEAGSLLGDPFAVGGCIMNSAGLVIEQFGVRCLFTPLSPPIDWVLENVVPACSSLPLVQTSEALLYALWSWLDRSRQKRVTVWVDWGYPVEYKALLAAQKLYDSDPLRFFAPIHEVASLYAFEPDFDRIEAARSAFPWLVRHNPIHDAIASACAVWRKSCDSLVTPSSSV